MSLRSTTSFSNKLNNLFKKLVVLACIFVVTIFIGNMIFGMFRQFFSQKRIIFHLRQREALLKQLEEENRRLKERLLIVQEPSFLDNQAAILLGFGDSPAAKEDKVLSTEITPTPAPLPFYKKWLKKIGF